MTVNKCGCPSRGSRILCFLGCRIGLTLPSPHFAVPRLLLGWLGVVHAAAPVAISRVRFVDDFCSAWKAFKTSERHPPTPSPDWHLLVPRSSTARPQNALSFMWIGSTFSSHHQAFVVRWHGPGEYATTGTCTNPKCSFAHNPGQLRATGKFFKV